MLSLLPQEAQANASAAVRRMTIILAAEHLPTWTLIRKLQGPRVLPVPHVLVGREPVVRDRSHLAVRKQHHVAARMRRTEELGELSGRDLTVRHAQGEERLVAVVP